MTATSVEPRIERRQLVFIKYRFFGFDFRKHVFVPCKIRGENNLHIVDSYISNLLIINTLYLRAGLDTTGWLSGLHTTDSAALRSVNSADENRGGSVVSRRVA